MKILELNIIEFGALKDKKISFGESLNIVFGENETGKSTIALFIKFMLYGLAKKSSKSVERERSLSLDGARAAGSMTLSLGGTVYLLERVATAGGRKSESAKLTNLLTGECITEGIAERLVGVPLEVFESSVLIGQMKAHEIKGEQVGTAIDNMLSSADESVDVAAILRRIDDVRKEYKLNRGEGGRLYETEKKISELSARCSQLTKKYLEAEELSARLERTKNSIKKTEESYERSKQVLDDVLGAGIILRFEELSAKREELAALSGELARLEDENSTDGFLPDREHAAALSGALTSFEDKSEQLSQREREAEDAPVVSEELCRLAELGKGIESGEGAAVLSRVKALTKKKKSLLAGGIVCIVGAVLSVGVGASLLGAVGGYIWAVLFGVGAVLALCGIGALLLSAKQKRKRDAACAPYGLPFDRLEDGFAECTSALEHCREAERQAAFCKARLSAALADKAAAERTLCALLGKTAVVSSEEGKNIALCRAELVRIKSFCAEREQRQAALCALESYTERAARELAAYEEAELRASVKTEPHSLTQKAIENARTHERYDRERLQELQKIEKNQMLALAGMKAETQSPASLADSIKVLRKTLEADTKYFDALMLAKEHIERASTQMSTSVTPEIGRRAGELLDLVSGGAHTSLQTTRTLDVAVENKGFLIDSDMLSGGAKDAMYICLRTALAEKVFDGERPPLILDEALCQLDDTRVARLLTLLGQLTANTQCIIFTCHMREADICKSRGMPFELHIFEKSRGLCEKMRKSAKKFSNSGKKGS